MSDKITPLQAGQLTLNFLPPLGIALILPVQKPFILTLTLLLATAGTVAARLTAEQLAQLPPAATTPVDFTRDIQPILEASCVKCHGRGKEKGGFRLDTRESFLKGGDAGPAATPGQSAQSYLIELVSGLDADNVMPVKGSKLTPKQVGLLRGWIDQGLPWAAGFSFAKPLPLNLHPREPKLPPARGGIEHPVDRLLQTYFAQHKIKPGRPVDDRTFARRAHLDAIGLLPEPKELEEFVADRRPDIRARLVARLLGDDRRYAEHWLTFWNDLLRNDYKGTGYIDGGRAQISAWLFGALAKNKPYDRFVAELINPNDKSAGFTKGIVWRGTVNASQIPPMQAAQNIAQVFMGVNLKCASCHDSFINDWTLADAYNLANIYADEPLEMFQCDKPTGKKAGMSFLYPELGMISAEAKKEDRLKRLAEILTQKPNGRLTRTVVNRVWAKFFGYGLVEPVDEMEQLAWNQDVLDWLAEDLAAHGYDLKRTMTLLMTSRAYQMPAVSMDESPHANFVFHGPAVRRLTAEQYRDALGTLTGVWYAEPAKGVNLGAAATPLAGSNSLPASVQWIWSQTNAASLGQAGTIYLHKTFVLAAAPVEAWAVASCDNSYTLYVNGTKVNAGSSWNEPNLLDLRPHLKKGTNLLAVSAVNHTPNDKPPAAGQPARAADANPAGFIFFTRIRHGGQTLELGTDQSWVWSKEKQAGWEKPGFSFEDRQPAAELGSTAIAPWNLDRALAGVFAMAKAHTDVRTSLVAADPLTLALGRPPREQVATTRPSAATTLQALELTNGETLSKVLQKGAAKVLAAKPASNREFIVRLYLKALGRKPTGAELKLADQLLGPAPQKDQVEDLLWSLAMLPEFQLIY